MEVGPVHEILPSSTEWPRGLDDARPRPERLRIIGALPDLRRAVGLVGTRAADPDGLAFARRLAADLASRGVVIISGGAFGIDAVAHRGALNAAGRTVAVLPGGLNQLAPSSHRELFAKIAQSGALVSEHEDEVPPQRSRFVPRNRLIAALGGVVVVVQAPVRSGALSTAAFAKAMGRPVLAVPSAPWQPRGQGCIELIRRGAKVCVGAQDVLTLLDSDPMLPFDSMAQAMPTPEIVPARSAEDPCLAKVVGALLAGPLHPDEILLRTDLSGEELRGALAQLLVTGRVRWWRGRYALDEEQS